MPDLRVAAGIAAGLGVVGAMATGIVVASQRQHDDQAAKEPNRAANRDTGFDPSHSKSTDGKSPEAVAVPLEAPPVQGSTLPGATGNPKPQAPRHNEGPTPPAAQRPLRPGQPKASNARRSPSPTGAAVVVAPQSAAARADAAMLVPRRLPAGAKELDRAGWLRLEPGPRGMKINVNGLAAHTVSRGDTLYGIARAYSQHYHLNITAKQLQAANGLTGTIIRPGQVLRLPNVVNASLDERIKRNPGLMFTVGGEPMHQIGRGETLNAIARHYNSEFQVATGAEGIKRANPRIISDVDVIGPHMAPISIPGLGVPAAAGGPGLTPPTLAALDGIEVATRRALVRYENGSTGMIDVMHYHLDGAHAQRVSGSINDALQAARLILGGSGQSRVQQAAVVQAKDGYWVAPLRAREDGGLDDSTRTIRLTLDQASPWMVGWAEVDSRTQRVVTDTWPDPSRS